MSSGLRIGILGLFAAAGAGLAICLATSETLSVHPAAHAERAAAAPSRTFEATRSSGDSNVVRSKFISTSNTAVGTALAPHVELRQPLGISTSSGLPEGKVFQANMAFEVGAPEPPRLPGLGPALEIVAPPKQLPSNDSPAKRRTHIGPALIGPVVKHPTPPAATRALKTVARSDSKIVQCAATEPAEDEPVPAVTQQIPAAGSPQVRRQVQDQLRQLLEAAQNHAGPELVEKPNASGAGPSAKPSASAGSAAATAPPVRAKPKITRVGEGDDHLTLDFQEADIRDVLEMISTEGQLNILPSNSVKGKVSASLHDVSLETALAAILKSTGYVTRRHGKFIYVGTAQDFESLEQSLDRVGTRIYKTNYVRAADLQALITPLLTHGVGAISVTAAAEQGIAADGSKAGGDTFAGGEAVLVRDYEAVLSQIDQVVEEIDRRPLQVAIEAMILSVKLDDTDQFGVNFELLRNKSHVLLASGSPPTSLGDVNFSNGGLTFGFLDTSLGAFLSAIETIGDTHVIATPRVVCINKHRAEILIGSQLGYVSSTVTETSTAQNVNFLEVGTQLRLRPFISSDGLIRMEVHPELSTGQVTIQQGFTLPQKDVTQVTTNVMVRDGATVVIGGLIREDLGTNTTQIPWLGNLPGVGFLFRQKTETTQRSEILVLLTPHIVYDNEACAEGSHGAEEFHRREAVYADQMSPFGKRHLGRQYLRFAQEAWARGDQPLAIRFVDLAIHFDPLNRAAIDLRSDIMTGDHFGRHTAVNFPAPAAPGAPEPEGLPLPDSSQSVQPQPGQPLPPWMLNDLEKPRDSLPEPVPPLLLHPLDPGVSGGSTNIDRPRQFQPQ
jgi:type IV pilus assembly protein PilQ